MLADENVEILAINMGEDEDTIFIFTADYPADFPLLLDREGAVAWRHLTENWRVRVRPEQVLEQLSQIP